MIANVKQINEVPQSVLEEIDMLIEAHNAGTSDDGSYYYVTIGFKRARFTLWKHNHKCLYGKTEQYLRTLGSDYETSVKKALELISSTNLPLEIHEFENIAYDYDKNKFQFGKYKGQEIDLIAKKDIKYLIWLANNASFNPKNTLIKGNLENVKAQVEFYFDTLTQKNKLFCKSEWIGNEGDTLKNVKYKITNASLTNGWYGEYIKVTAVDDNGNLLTFSLNSGRVTLPKTIDKDTIIKISSCKIKKHYEKVGKKYTELFRIRFQKEK